jgi:peptidoglycan/LPS O-acetylase OafA/YrhL
MRVNVSGKQFVFPRHCACCGAFPLTSLIVFGSESNKRSRTKGWSWEVPYCVACKRHVRRTEVTALLSLVVIGVTLISGLAVAALSGKWTPWAEYVSTSVIAELALSFAILRVIRNKCSDSCCGTWPAVIYLGSVGSCHSFDIKSRTYAAEFVRSNHLKLVNASPMVVALLRGAKTGNYQVPRRILSTR